MSKQYIQKYMQNITLDRGNKTSQNIATPNKNHWNRRKDTYKHIKKTCK